MLQNELFQISTVDARVLFICPRKKPLFTQTNSVLQKIEIGSNVDGLFFKKIILMMFTWNQTAAQIHSGMRDLQIERMAND